MYAFRTTWIVKEGKIGEAVALATRDLDKNKPAEAGLRIYTPHFSPSQLVWEELWESIEAHDVFWEKLGAQLEEEGYWDKWNALIERSLGTEVWIVQAWS
ncbi:MAG: hypothetical protein JXC32_19760 [Anaerolineae bacterium]|nr:hypothetical protein [Anaerolineae bacterium]